ncbi:MAG: tetratricopeptide (TPR) repeat protein, partial [Planctomycetota bacterium]
ERSLESKDYDGARRLIERALERDRRATAAWDLRARWAAATENLDEQIYSLHKHYQLSVAQGVHKRDLKVLREQLALIDPISADLYGMKELFLKKLIPIAERYVKEKRPHSAIRVYKQILALDPENKEAQLAIEKIASTPDPSLAENAKPKDLFADVTDEWIAEHDKEHLEWSERAKSERDNYITYTNAGYEVLVQTAESMEQMNAFYRQFFRYGTEEHGGSVPRIGVNIFRNRDEYLEKGIGPPIEWSGGHFTGSYVETYIGDSGFNGMVGTLFHEAAHQFVSLATSAVGWLNEGLASFFEGTRILPNGTVIMNMPANGRLMPLADRMDRGWMADANDGIDPSDANSTPETAPTFRIVLENRYGWGPPWYAPTWGVVYFLYNYQDPVDGRFVYRTAFQEFIDKSGGRMGEGAVRNFEEVVLMNPSEEIKGVDRSEHPDKIALPETVDELDEVWKEWIIRLRDEQRGSIEVDRPYQQWGRYAVMNKDYIVAKDHFEKGLVEQPDDIELLMDFADLLSGHFNNPDRASKLVREAIYFIENQPEPDDERLKAAERILGKLDPRLKSLGKVQTEMAATARAIVQRYQSTALHSMVMDVSWRLGSDLDLPDLFEIYEQAVRARGRSLHIWSLAYNEENMDGWTTQGTDPVFTSNGAAMQATFGEFDETDFTFRSLALDEVTSGDFSMEADVQAVKGRVNFCGFTFGQKDSSTFHGMLLFPGKTVAAGAAETGYIDLMSNFGGTMKTWRHIPVNTSEVEGESTTGKWSKLRLDVSGAKVDMWYDGELISSHDFGSTDVVRGSFGLVMGPGKAIYRNVRYLARDPRDPGGKIEREMKLEELRKTSGGAVGGSFQGMVAPFPEVQRWAQGEERTAWDEKGPVPQLLVFFSIPQNDKLAIGEWLSDLAVRTKHYGLEVVSICSPNDDADIDAYLKEHEWPGSVGVDLRPHGAFGIGNSNEAFFIRRFNLPRLLLIDLDQTVIWEGDPGFEVGWEYDPDFPSFLKEPLDELITKRKLTDLARWRQKWKFKASPAMAKGDLESALDELKQAADFNARYAPDAGTATSRLKAAEAAVQSLESTAATFQREEADPALTELLAWAPLLEIEINGRRRKDLKDVLASKIAKDWDSVMKEAAKFLKSKRGDPSDRATAFLGKIERRNGRFALELREDLQAAADDGDWVLFESHVEQAEGRPRRWMAIEYFGWKE